MHKICKFVYSCCKCAEDSIFRPPPPPGRIVCTPKASLCIRIAMDNIGLVGKCYADWN